MQTVLQSTAQPNTPPGKMSSLQRTPATHSIGAILVGVLAIGTAIVLIGRYRERRATRHRAPATRGPLVV